MTESSEFEAQSGVVNFRFSGFRKHTSVRIDSNLWKEFVKACKNNGFSTCDCLEKLILGFLVGINQMCHKPTTLTVVVDAPRVVKRVRRRQLVFDDEVSWCVEGVRVFCDFLGGFSNENGEVFVYCRKGYSWVSGRVCEVCKENKLPKNK
jgi:hypothetical protein